MFINAVGVRLYRQEAPALAANCFELAFKMMDLNYGKSRIIEIHQQMVGMAQSFFSALNQVRKNNKPDDPAFEEYFEDKKTVIAEVEGYAIYTGNRELQKDCKAIRGLLFVPALDK